MDLLDEGENKWVLTSFHSICNNINKIQKELLVLLCCKKNYFIQINRDIDSDRKPTYWLRDSQQLDLNASKSQP